jgi:hypothetical protein
MTRFLALSILLTACANQAQEEGDPSASGARGGNVSVTTAPTPTGNPDPGKGGAPIYAEDAAATNGLLPVDSTHATGLMNDPELACSGWTEEPESSGSVLEFVVDVSGSMDKTAPSTNGATKWVVTRDALKQALQSLPQGIPVGLTFFPNMPLYASEFPRPVAACVDTKDNVWIAPKDLNHQKRLLAALDAIQMNRNGATPTHDAYKVALEELRATTEPGAKYLVLITDGQPTQSLGCIGNGMTCYPEPTQPVVDAIAAAFNTADPIQTFVVGSPGSEKNDCTNADVRDWLSAAARVGGTATAGCSDSGPKYCHFDLTNEQIDFGNALVNSLETIIAGIISCDYAVPPPPNGETIDTNLVNLIYRDGTGAFNLVLPSKSDACEIGWHFTDESRTKIHVCPQTCKQLQDDSMAQVTLLFGCTREQVGPTII